MSSSGSCCCVIGCRNNYINTKASTPKISFYSFPAKSYLLERRKIWTNFVKRKGNDGKTWEPKKWHKICSAHFIGGSRNEDPRHPGYNPTIHPMSSKVINGSLKMDRYNRLMNRRKNLYAVNNGGTQYNDDQNIANQKLLEKPNKVMGKNLLGEENQEMAEEKTSNIPIKTKCFVCFESQNLTENNNSSTMLIPERVMNYVSASRKLTADTIKSLQLPPYSSLLKNIHCGSCRFLCDNVYQLSVQLDEIKMKLNSALESYISRIVKCRETAASGSSIRVAKYIFSENIDYDRISQSTKNTKMASNNCGSTSAGLPQFIKILPHPEDSPQNHQQVILATMSSKQVPNISLDRNSDSTLDKIKQTAIITKIQKKGEKFPDADFNTHKVYRFKCKQCPKVFWSEVGLQAHSSRHPKYDKPDIIGNEKPLGDQTACCENKFSGEYKKQKNANEQKTLFQCVKCSKCFALRHILSHHYKNKPNCHFIRCSICKVKISPDLIQSHNEHYHPSSGIAANLQPAANKVTGEDVHSQRKYVNVPTQFTAPSVPKSSPKCTTCKTPLQRNESIPQNLVKKQITGKVSYYCVNCKKTFMLVPNPRKKLYSTKI